MLYFNTLAYLTSKPCKKIMLTGPPKPLFESINFSNTAHTMGRPLFSCVTQ